VGDLVGYDRHHLHGSIGIIKEVLPDYSDGTKNELATVLWTDGSEDEVELSLLEILNNGNRNKDWRSCESR